MRTPRSFFRNVQWPAGNDGVGYAIQRMARPRNFTNSVRISFTTSILPKAALHPSSRNSSAMQLTAANHGGPALAIDIPVSGVTTQGQWHEHDT